MSGPAIVWTLVWLRDGGDIYAGEKAALYRDDVKVWEGSSYDQAEAIVRAIVGGALVVREVVDRLPLTLGENGSDRPITETGHSGPESRDTGRSKP